MSWSLFSASSISEHNPYAIIYRTCSTRGMEGGVKVRSGQGGKTTTG
jgi:hypothetical protein